MFALQYLQDARSWIPHWKAKPQRFTGSWLIPAAPANAIFDATCAFEPGGGVPKQHSTNFSLRPTRGYYGN
jgi:hypothetical protein